MDSLTTGAPRRLGEANDFGPRGSPQVDRIAFNSNRDGDYEIFALSRDGGGSTNLTQHPSSDEHAFASADGALIVFDSNRGGGELQLYVMNPDGSNPRRVSSSTTMDFWSSIRSR